LARVGELTISQREVDETILTRVNALEKQLYAVRKAALDNVIIQKLLELEARRRTISVDALKKEMLAGPVSVANEEIDRTYEQNAPAFGLLSPHEAKEKIRLDLEAQVRLSRYRQKLEELKKRTSIEVVMEEPRLTWTMSTEAGASIGPMDAPVVITEFSDFQCPYCRDVQPILKRLLIEYGDSVRLNYKHLPLPNHPFALLAARSAHCAGKQKAFWQVHDRLFAAPTLTREIIDQLPDQLNLNKEMFQRCLANSETGAAVARDVGDARKLGINATPSFIINGKLFSGLLQFDELRLIVEQELRLAQTTGRKQTPQPQTKKEVKK
jgi:predicted DsbA family dithiol-disulfide isomerase